MSDYIKVTNFTSKDSLPTGNANKIVKGTEIDNEFIAIAVSIATKADLDGPTFTGAPKAPTASLGTNTTQLATTSFVAASIAANVIIPSGSVMLFYQAAAPSGWTQVTTLNDYDLRLVSGTGGTTGGTTAYSTVFSNQTPTFTGSIGTLSSSATTLSIAQMPSHNHSLNVANEQAGGSNLYWPSGTPNSPSFSTGNEGGGGSHSHSLTGAPGGTVGAVTLNVRYANVIICSKN